MKIPDISARGVRLWGFIIIGMALVNYAHDYYTRIVLSFPLNMGIAIGNLALMVIGGTTLVIASYLIRLEQRLDRMEGTHSRSTGATRGDDAAE